MSVVPSSPDNGTASGTVPRGAPAGVPEILADDPALLAFISRAAAPDRSVPGRGGPVIARPAPGRPAHSGPVRQGGAAGAPMLHQESCWTALAAQATVHDQAAGVPPSAVHAAISAYSRTASFAEQDSAAAARCIVDA